MHAVAKDRVSAEAAFATVVEAGQTTPTWKAGTLVVPKVASAPNVIIGAAVVPQTKVVIVPQVKTKLAAMLVYELTLLKLA